jgi:hypothetical protein
MINKEELSKYKSIYRVYTTDDKIVHCEKYPVIYANSEWLYYKVARKQELNRRELKSIISEYTGISNSDVNYWGHYDKYYWKVENFNSEQATNDVFATKKKDDADRIKREMEKAERDYLQLKEKYSKMTTE